MFENEAVKLILPTRGGVGVAGILPYLNFPVIQSNPKLISGYSDITVLLNVLYEYANLITLHSLLLLDFNLSTPAYNFNQFFGATSVRPAPWQIINPPEMPLVSRVPGNVTGPIVGGNLTSFIDTLGTPFEINTAGKIILLEETHEPINTVYRYLNRPHHLRSIVSSESCTYNIDYRLVPVSIRTCRVFISPLLFDISYTIVVGRTLCPPVLYCGRKPYVPKELW